MPLPINEIPSVEIPVSSIAPEEDCGVLLTIRQEGARHQGIEGASDGTGGWIWHASKCLAKYLLSPQNVALVEGKNILELGSGTGWLALTLSMSKNAPCHIVATERPCGLPLLCRNIYGFLEKTNDDQNYVEGGDVNIDVQSLDWRESNRIEGDFDLIVAADVVYMVEIYPFLLRTIIAHGGRCIISWEERKPDEEILFLELAQSLGFYFLPPTSIGENPVTANKIWLVDMCIQS